MRWRGARTVRPRRCPLSAPLRRLASAHGEVGWHRVTGGGARSSIVLGLGKHLRHVRENRGESVESILNSKSNATVIRARARAIKRCCHDPEIFLQTSELHTTWFYYRLKNNCIYLDEKVKGV